MNNFNPCFILPNYNHGNVCREVIAELTKFGYPIILVNDASNDETTQILREINKAFNLVQLLELKENLGKGGAVIEGLFEAGRKQFSHAFQVDSDGQHNLDDIEHFLEFAEEKPEQLVCGYPIYDQSVPMSRLLPRYITHFWVWVETLSFSIVDSMCGFRVYPLEPVLNLLNKQSLGKRMDFDIEILVRLYWMNIPMKFLPTKVIYPEDGESHFNLWKDNWLITKMHTKLFFGMLVRFPSLIFRGLFSKKINMKKTDTLHWSSEKEKGTSLGIYVLVWSYKLLGSWAFRILLVPVIAYFTTFSTRARNASIQYQTQLAEFQNKKSQNKTPQNDESQNKKIKIGWKQVFAHFYEFANAAIDKIGSWTGQIPANSVTIHNPEVNESILSSGKGAVFIGSHLGNLELSRAIGQNRTGLVINAVVFNKHALKFQNVLNKSNPDVRLNLIHVESIGSDTAILLRQKVDQGEAVIIVADRTSVNAVGRVEYANFLGKAAPFPQGPFVLAGLLECPVYLIFCIREADGYHVYHEHFSDSLKLPRKDRQLILKNTIQNYANRLSFFCQKAPMQWFNFFDFWQQDKIGMVRHKIQNDSKTER